MADGHPEPTEIAEHGQLTSTVIDPTEWITEAQSIAPSVPTLRGLLQHLCNFGPSLTPTQKSRKLRYYWTPGQ